MVTLYKNIENPSLKKKLIPICLPCYLFADSYYMCVCLCLDADFPDKWNDLPFKNGVCENRHMEGFCPYTCNVGYTGDCCQTSVGKFFFNYKLM